MPTYEYKCKACGKEFFEILSIREHEEIKVTCPQCRSDQVEQLLSHFVAQTSRKN